MPLNPWTNPRDPPPTHQGIAKLRRWRSRGVPARCQKRLPNASSTMPPTPRKASAARNFTLATGMEDGGWECNWGWIWWITGFIWASISSIIEKDIISYKIKLHCMISYYIISLYHYIIILLLIWLGSWMGDWLWDSLGRFYWMLKVSMANEGANMDHGIPFARFRWG